ncbi:MAG: hypothetical protein IJB72_00795 [Clostridia bacterium]|nr:hypothetical protein [Clostridia bacterium]
MKIKHFFRDGEKMQEHFEEHGEQTNSQSAEEYLVKANKVINNPKALKKYETDEYDNDMVYYLPPTGEIVFVSAEGYIRTYFIADDEYFERQ